MSPSRMPWLDNAKALLILLVVWGHLMERAAFSAPLFAGIYGAIYLFHMPAFVLLSGMVTPSQISGLGLMQSMRRLLVPLVVFQILYWPVLGGSGDPLQPIWILWFLLSLATWRLMLPVFIKLPFPVPLSIGIALAAGFVDAIDYTLSLSRTLVFFPAFLVGHLYSAQIATLSQRARWPGVLLFVVLTVGAGTLAAKGADVTLLYGSRPYAATEGTLLVPVVLRLAIILSGIIASVAFLSAVPRGSGLLTQLGTRTMSVFLLHGFVVVAFWNAPAGALPGGPMGFLVLTGVLALLVSSLLATIPLTLAGRGSIFSYRRSEEPPRSGQT